MMEAAPMMEMELPSCAMCGASAHRILHQGGRFAPYGVVKCASCAFLFLSPRPTESAMQALYRQDDYFSSGDDRGYSGYDAQEEALRRTFARLLRWLDQHGMSGGRLLEVGAGYGYLLDEAAPYFEVRHGTDYSSGAVQRAAAVSDRMFHGGLESVPAQETYNLIIANHVIEHVYQPHDFVRRARELLSPGGHLLLSTPDAGSFWRMLMRSRWPSYKLPEHVLYFDFSSLTRLMEGGGAQQVRRVPYPHAFPLELIASKLRLKAPASIERLSLWLPRTTVAAIARF